jgi:hypothetical protein
MRLESRRPQRKIRLRGLDLNSRPVKDWLIAVLLLLNVGCSHRRPSDELFAPTQPETSRSEPSSSAQFTDVTEQAHIRFTHNNGAEGKFHLPETTGSGCAFLDFDNDEWLDVLLLNGKSLEDRRQKAEGRRQSSSFIPHPSSLVLYHNNRDGTFTDVTRGSGLDVAIYSMGCAVGDFDNDGRDDIFVTTCLDGNRLFRNEGEGKFKDVTSAVFGSSVSRKWSASCAWLDYDNDGWLDLFVCNYVKYKWSDDAACNRGQGYLAYCNPRFFPPQSSTLYHNDGKGHLMDVTERAGISRATAKALGVCLLDYDDDGWLDILVASDTTRNLLFHNVPHPPSPTRPHAHTSTRRFEEVGLNAGVALADDGKTRAGMGIDAADVAGDGRLSVLISNFSGEGLSLFQQERPQSAFLDNSRNAGVWEGSLHLLGFGLFFFDFDNDGWRDAFVANGHVQPDVGKYEPNVTYGERNLLFRNVGEGRFAEVGRSAGKPFTYQRVGRGAAYGDYDNDGDLDVLINNNGQPTELLRNDGGNKKNWLQVELKGKKRKEGEGRGSNRSGIGAKVIVQTGQTTQRDVVRSGSSYCSQSALRLHFGLGDATTASEIVVRWNSGVVDKRQNVQANQRITIVEGENPAK